MGRLLSDGIRAYHGPLSLRALRLCLVASVTVHFFGDYAYAVRGYTR
jgi:hypothetical protein